jgi:hypothetical protein
MVVLCTKALISVASGSYASSREMAARKHRRDAERRSSTCRLTPMIGTQIGTVAKLAPAIDRDSDGRDLLRCKPMPLTKGWGGFRSKACQLRREISDTARIGERPMIFRRSDPETLG